MTVPAITFAWIAGTVYASLLWAIARGVARARACRLGSWPFATIAGAGATAAAIAATYSGGTAILLGAGAVGTFVCAAVDARTGLIFDALTIAMTCVAGVLVAMYGNPLDAVVAATAIGGVLLALHFGSGRRGIGLGDVKLGAALSLTYGLPLGSVAIGSAFVVGAAYACIAIATRRATRTDTLRFGPFIAAGTVVSLIGDVLGYRL